MKYIAAIVFLFVIVYVFIGGCNTKAPDPLIKHKWFIDYEYATGEKDTVNYIYISENKNVKLELTGHHCVAVVSGLYVENIACSVRRFKIVVYNKEYVR